MKSNRLMTWLLVGVVSSVGALADMQVAKSADALVVTSSVSGTVIAKVMSPDDRLIVNEKYEGSSFTWSPPAGANGAYRYDVRVIKASQNAQVQNGQVNSSATTEAYAGGSVEVKNGKIEEPNKDTVEEQE